VTCENTHRRTHKVVQTQCSCIDTTLALENFEQSFKQLQHAFHADGLIVEGYLRNVRELAHRKATDAFENIIFRLKNKAISRVLRSWSIELQERKRQTSVLTCILKMHKCFMKSALYMTFAIWKNQVNANSWALESLRFRVSQTSVYLAFTAWFEHAVKKKRMEGALEKAVWRMKKVCVWRTWANWSAVSDQALSDLQMLELAQVDRRKGELALFTDELDGLKQVLESKNKQIKALEVKYAAARDISFRDIAELRRTSGELVLKSKALEASEKAREAAEKRHSKDSETWNETSRGLAQTIQARCQDITELNSHLEHLHNVQRSSTLALHSMNVDREKLASALRERERQLEQARGMLNEATGAVKLMEEAMEGLRKEMHERIGSVGGQARDRVVRIQEEIKTRVAEVVAEYAEDLEIVKIEAAKENLEKERLKAQLDMARLMATALAQQWDDQRKELEESRQVLRDALEAVNSKLTHETKALSQGRHEVDQIQSRAVIEEETTQNLLGERHAELTEVKGTLKDKDEQMRQLQDQMLNFVKQVRREQSNSCALLREVDERGKEVIVLRSELAQLKSLVSIKKGEEDEDAASSGEGVGCREREGGGGLRKGHELALKQCYLQGLEERLQETSEGPQVHQTENVALRADLARARSELGETVFAMAEAWHKFNKEREEWGIIRNELEVIIATLITELKLGEEVLSKNFCALEA
jgi:chromosome segregation ATPase